MLRRGLGHVVNVRELVVQRGRQWRLVEVGVVEYGDLQSEGMKTEVLVHRFGLRMCEGSIFGLYVLQYLLRTTKYTSRGNRHIKTSVCLYTASGLASVASL